MDDETPCCATAAGKKIKKVMISGQDVGIAQLDEIIARIAALNLKDEEAIGRALLKEVKIYNYVPASKELDYRNAMMNEYARRNSNGGKN
jgi:hypothetical protein